MLLLDQNPLDQYFKIYLDDSERQNLPQLYVIAAGQNSQAELIVCSLDTCC